MALLGAGLSTSQNYSGSFNPNDTLNPLHFAKTRKLAFDYAQKNKVDSCLLLINICIRNLKTEKERKAGFTALLTSPELSNLRDKNWIKLRDNLSEDLKKMYEPELNFPLFLKLLTYHTEDQNARWAALASKSKSINCVNCVDTLNLKHLRFVDSLLKQNVRLSKVTIGVDGMEAIFLFIQHCQDTVRQATYSKLIEGWFNSGDLSGGSYALYRDRIRVNQKQPQIYGTQFWKDEKTDQLVLYPVENIVELNKIRKKMGMKSIQYYLLNVEFLEKKRFNRESVSGLLKGNENLQDFISKEMQD